MVFVFAFVAVFERMAEPDERPSLRASLIAAVALAVAAAAIVPLVFEDRVPGPAAVTGPDGRESRPMDRPARFC